MKIKYTFVGLLALLLLISISQIFSLPPYGEDVFPAYKSGYFRELDRGFRIITDSFLGIKTLSRPVYGWIFLEDIKKKYGYTVEVFNSSGIKVSAPGMREDVPDEDVRAVLNSLAPEIETTIDGGRYIAVIPVTAENECRFCHRGYEEGSAVGALRFSRNFDSRVYYTAERVIIFLLLSIILTAALFFVMRWDPDRNVKELFDKS